MKFTAPVDTGLTLFVSLVREDNGQVWNETATAWQVAPAESDRKIDLTEGTGIYVGDYSGENSGDLGSPGLVTVRLHETVSGEDQTIGASAVYVKANVEVTALEQLGWTSTLASNLSSQLPISGFIADSLSLANVQSAINTVNTNLTSGRAANLDNLDSAVSAVQTAINTTNTNLTPTRAAKLDLVEAMRGTDNALLAASYTASPTVGAIADAVLDEALSGHATAGTLGKAVADVPTAATTAAAVDAAIANAADATDALSAIADKIASDWVAGDASPVAIAAAVTSHSDFTDLTNDVTSTLTNLSEIKGTGYNSATDSLAAIADAGDGSWSDTEKRYIRHRLGINGDVTAPTQDPSLSNFDPTVDTVAISSVGLDAIADSILYNSGQKIAADSVGRVTTDGDSRTASQADVSNLLTTATYNASIPSNFDEMLVETGTGKVTTSNPATSGGSNHTAQDVRDLILAGDQTPIITATGGVDVSSAGVTAVITQVERSNGLLDQTYDKAEESRERADQAVVDIADFRGEVLDAAEIRTELFVNPANKLLTDGSGFVTSTNAGSGATATELAAAILTTPANTINTNAQGEVTADSSLLASDVVTAMQADGTTLDIINDKLPADTAARIGSIEPMRGTDNALLAASYTVPPTAIQVAGAVLLDTDNKLLTDVTGQVTTSNPTTGGTGSSHTPADVAAAILASPTNKLTTDTMGSVTTTAASQVASRADLATLPADVAAEVIASGGVGGGATPSEVAAAILANPANLLATDATGQVTAGNVSAIEGFTTIGSGNLHVFLNGISEENQILEVIKSGARTFTVSIEANTGVFDDPTPTDIQVILRDSESNVTTIENASIQRIAEDVQVQVIRFTISTAMSAVMATGFLRVQFKIDSQYAELGNHIKIVDSL